MLPISWCVKSPVNCEHLSRFARLCLNKARQGPPLSLCSTEGNRLSSYSGSVSVKCGITGLAQINGFRCSNTSIQKWIEQDLYYMQNWSLLLDLNIIFKSSQPPWSQERLQGV